MKPLSVTFLGTCSGGGPLLSRACTATMLNIDHAHWLVDCAEGTQIQLKRAKFKPELISNVFITHMHIDHVMGLIPLMRTVMNKDEPTSTRLRMQIYGPYGLRKFVRLNLQLTLTELRGRYAVHELLGPSDEPSISCEADLLHVNENPGNDIRPDEQGLWRNVVSDKDWTVHAGPLQHRAPAVGYVFQEDAKYTYRPEHYVPQIQRNMHHLRTGTIRDSVQESILRRVIGNRESVSLPDGTTLNPPPIDIPGRKIVILGDTYDSRGIMPLCYDASLLVHEATQMAIPQDLARRVSQFRKGCSEEEARKVALKHGHSTAAMAGEFARDIRAKRLFLNHFSIKLSLYGARDDPHGRDRSPQRSKNNKKRRYDVLDDIMDELESQASATWGLGNAVATSDLQTVYIPRCDPSTPDIQGALSPSPPMANAPSNRA